MNPVTRRAAQAGTKANVCVIGTRVSDQRFMIIYSDPGREVRRG